MRTIDTANMTDEQAQQYLDELRAAHPINGTLQNLGAFVFHAQEKAGEISPSEVVRLVQAVEEAIKALMEECSNLAQENRVLRQTLDSVDALIGTGGGNT